MPVSDRTILHTSVHPELAEHVRRAAQAENRSVSYLIRRTLEQLVGYDGQEQDDDEPRTAA